MTSYILNGLRREWRPFFTDPMSLTKSIDAEAYMISLHPLVKPDDFRLLRLLSAFCKCDVVADC